MSVPFSNKKYDDSNWKEEYKIHTNSFFKLKLLEEGAKSLAQSWIIQAMYVDWKKKKGYDKLDPDTNEGQYQSSYKEFLKKTST